jgi:membrane protein YdbS with pleckstrin-like domain
MKGRLLEDRAEAAVWILVVILSSALLLVILWFMGLGWFTVAAFVIAVILTVIVIPYRERKKKG